MATVRVFRYLPDLDAFVATTEYAELADFLGLMEWHPAVWIGRLFCMDNDAGEHWFDNWKLREPLEARAADMAIQIDQLFIIDSDRFQDGRDGPCHDAGFRKRFWTDVLKSLELSYELLFDEARRMNDNMRQNFPEHSIYDLEERIQSVRDRAGP